MVYSSSARPLMPIAFEKALPAFQPTFEAHIMNGAMNIAAIQKPSAAVVGFQCFSIQALESP